MNRFAWAIAVCAGTLLMYAPQSRADTTINFDDLTDNGNGTRIANGYQGPNWTNFYVMNTSDFYNDVGTNGYTNGTVSSPNVAFNGYGNAAAISDGSFLFDSAYFTAAWNNGLTITVDGYLGGNLVNSTSFQVNATGPTLESFNWTVDTLDFSSSGGTNAGYHGEGSSFAMDNMVISSPTISPVPKPSSILLLSTTLGPLLLAMRRSAKRKELRR